MAKGTQLLKQDCRVQFWSIALDPESHEALVGSVQSARDAGFHEPFHVFAENPVEGAETYRAEALRDQGSFAPLIALKAALAKLSVPVWVWITPGTRFHWKHPDITWPMDPGPLHAPFFGPDLRGAGPDSTGSGDQVWDARAASRLGISGPIYGTSDGLWMVRSAAIDRVFDLAREFRGKLEAEGLRPGWRDCLAFCSHLLCPDRRRHHVSNLGEFWQALRPAREAGVCTASAELSGQPSLSYFERQS